jgi:hypothetical protein
MLPGTLRPDLNFCLEKIHHIRLVNDAAVSPFTIVISCPLLTFYEQCTLPGSELQSPGNLENMHQVRLINKAVSPIQLLENAPH